MAKTTGVSAALLVKLSAVTPPAVVVTAKELVESIVPFSTHCATEDAATNVAPTATSALVATTQVDRPLHPCDHPENTKPAAGVAVSVTRSLELYATAQVEGHEICCPCVGADVDVTVPEPVTVTVTV